MLILKPLTIDWPVAGAKIQAVAFTALFRFNHARTRTYVRLLGPCFKTGRMEPFCHRGVTWVSFRANREEIAESLSPNPERALTRHYSKTPPYTTQARDCTEASTTRHIRSSADELPCPQRYPRHRTGDDTQGKKHRTQPDQNPKQRLR